MDLKETDGPPPGMAFDEEWYLSEYPAVAGVVRSGGFRSGWEHYVLHGRAEGRHPVPLTQIALAATTGPTHQPGAQSGPPFRNHNGAGFLTPSELAVSKNEPGRVAVIGPRSGGAGWLRDTARPGCHVDLIDVDTNSRPPERTAAELSSYAFFIVLVPLREIIDAEALGQTPYRDVAAHARLFHRACQLLEIYLTSQMRWNLEHGVLTFVANFFVPQHNPMGRLFPRYDLRNPEYFVSELNRHLEMIVRRHDNAFVLEFDRIAASIGRRFVQDDLLFPMKSGTVLPFEFAESGWIGPLAAISDHYDIRTRSLFPDALWAELTAMYRTACQSDAVKLVVVEPVDTLWKAGGADKTNHPGPITNGWPAGVTEALVYLRKRGIQIAIISQNEEQLIRGLWPNIVGHGLRIADFSAIRVNWRPKPENMSELLHELNLPARSVLFIDADPSERDAMREAFPEIRTLGDFPYYLRRTLLWSAETQTSEQSVVAAAGVEVIWAPAAQTSPDATGGGLRDPINPAFETPRQRLEQLWVRAMNNDITPDEAREIQRLGMGLAVADHGIRRVRPFRNWDKQ